MTSVKLTTAEWIAERLANCQRIARMKTGKDRAGWLEDARYFEVTLRSLDALGRTWGVLASCVSALEDAHRCLTGEGIPAPPSIGVARDEVESFVRAARTALAPEESNDA